MTHGTIAIERVNNTRFHLAHFKPKNPWRKVGGAKGGRDNKAKEER